MRLRLGFVLAAALAVPVHAAREAPITPSGGGNIGGSPSGISHGGGPVFAPAPMMPSPGRAERGMAVPPSARGAAPKGVPMAPGRAAAAPGAAPPAAPIIRDPNFVNQVQRIEVIDTEPDFFFWHAWGDFYFCHYFNDYGDWYGYYSGPSFYWTQYYGGHWWWWDEVHKRWLFAYGGEWWWKSPEGQLYTYSGGAYQKYLLNSR